MTGLENRLDGLVADDVVMRAFAESSAASLITDADQRVIFANDAYGRLTGYSSDDMRGRNCRVLQGPETDSSTIASMRDALQGGSGFRGTILNCRKDGGKFRNLLAVSPVKDESGRTINFTSVLLDVSDQVRDRDTSRLLLETARLRISAVTGIPEERVIAGLASSFQAADSPELTSLTADLRPFMVSATGASEWARELLSTHGLSGCAAFPVMLHGECSPSSWWGGAPARPPRHSRMFSPNG